MKLIKLLLLLTVCCLPVLVKAQLISWQENRPLTWDDFKGPPSFKTDGDAATHCDMSYHYTVKHIDTSYIATFTFVSGFNPQVSWAFERSENEDLLKHEQLHFDIHELYVRKLVHALESATYTSNYRAEIAAIAAEYHKSSRAAQEKYDQDSNHSRDVDRQTFWERYIHGQLKAIPKNY